MTLAIVSCSSRNAQLMKYYRMHFEISRQRMIIQGVYEESLGDF